MVFYCQFDPSLPAPKIPMPPFPEQKIFFYPYDPVEADYFLSDKKMKLPPSTVVGPQPERVNIKLGHHHMVIKVGFKPGGLHRLLGIPMTELLRVEAFDARELLGPAVDLLNQQLSSCTDIKVMISLIESFLLKKIKRREDHQQMDHAFDIILRSGGLTSIDLMASEACLSLRQFERKFKQQIGLSPKFYSRMVRFAKAWNLKESDPALPWIKIAYECGYADQMHLVKDFREFAGVNPSFAAEELRLMPFRTGD